MKKYPRLEEAKVIQKYNILLIYDSGEKRIYDFTPNLEHSFYKQLEDEILFRDLYVENGELLWKTGQDFCPHTLYDLSMPE